MKDILKNYASSKIVTTILLVLLFFITNWLSYGAYIRFDLSRTGRFRLTSATKSILRKLPDKAILEVFFSGNPPDAYLQQIKLSKDFLSEYASASGGRMKISILDPDSSESAKERVQSLKIPQTQISVQGEGDLEVKRIYLAAVLSYGDKVEIIQNILNTRFLEYDLTSRIYRMAYPGERGVAYLSNHGGFSLETENSMQSLEVLSNSLESFYGKLKAVNTTEEEIPSDVTTLLIIGPASLSPIDKFRVDQFIMRGGNVIFAVSGMQVDFNSGRVFPVSQDILDFIKHYGFTIGADMVFEPKNFIPIRRPLPGNPFSLQQIPYPAWVFVNEKGIEQDHPISKGNPGVFFPWVSSLVLDPAKMLKKTSDNEGAKDNSGKKDSKGNVFKVLAKSTPNAWNQSSNIILAPEILAQSVSEKNPDSKNRNTGTFNMVAYAEGMYPSFFGKDNPPPKEAPRYFLKESERSTRIMAVSTPFILTSDPLSRAQQANMSNLSFVLAALDVMNGLEEIVESRSKDVAQPLLPVLKPAEQQIWTWLNFALPLLIIVIIGFIRLWKRNKLSQKEFVVEG